MPEPAERDRFLATVRLNLDLPDEIAAGVVEELNGHLEDATAELCAAGVATADAEQRALGRLGDARLLGAELTRARHQRRRLLAAVGGGVRALFVEGIRLYVVLSLMVVGASVFALLVASSLVQMVGRHPSGFFEGPLGSLGAVVAVIIASAYLGWVLPARIALPAMRSVRGLRQVVAWAGLIIGSLALWLVVRLPLDPVLALGVPAGPVTFAFIACRAPERPTVRMGWTVAVLGGALLIVPLTFVAIVTATASDVSWMADSSVIGDAPSAADVRDVALDINWTAPPQGAAQVTVDAGDAVTVVAARLPTLQVEVWPARVIDEVMEFGAVPLLVERARTERSTTITYVLPRLREPVTTAMFVVGVAPDGRRVVIAEEFSLSKTPPWAGTLADWWFGGD